MSASGSRRVAWDLLALSTLAALLFVPWLGSRDLWNPNEPLYAQGVAEMVARGDWTLPWVNDRVFDEKPILYFWLARVASVLLGGVSELSVRLPSAVAGVVSVLLVYLLVRPYAGVARARLAAALLATMFIVFWSARTVQMDLPLTAATLGTILAVARVLDHGMTAWRGFALGGLAAGLGVLAKGPVGLVCPGLVLGIYWAVSRRRGTLGGAAPLAGAAALVAVVAPWLFMLWRREATGVFAELVYRQNFERFVDPWDHQQPWWYYLKYFWIDMAPWSFFFPLAWGLRARDESERRLDRLAWIWLLALVVFFSASASKRSPYLLPAAPAVAILLSAVAERWRAGSLGPSRVRIALLLHAAAAVALVALGTLLVLAPPAELTADPAVQHAGRLLALVLLGGGAAIGTALVRSRKGFGAPSALFGFVVVLYLVSAASILPAADYYKSPRPFGQAIHARVGPEDPLRGYRLWKWRASYSYYAGRPIRSLESLDELRAYWELPGRVFLIVEQGQLDEARQVLGDVEPLETRVVGNTRVSLFGREPFFN